MVGEKIFAGDIVEHKASQSTFSACGVCYETDELLMAIYPKPEIYKLSECEKMHLPGIEHEQSENTKGKLRALGLDRFIEKE